MNKKYKFINSCVTCGDGRVIDEMMDKAIDITLKTFFKHVSLKQVKAQFGYGKDLGICLKDDWHTSYHRSKWNGERCYIFVHSGIEYIYKMED